VDIADLAASMGIKPTRVTTTLDRLVSWGLVTQLGGTIGLSGYGPVVPPPRLARLPAKVVAAHVGILLSEQP
jgi:predicted transcriptional regulator